MMRFDPSIRLSRLVIIKEGRRAYDENFHPGVNIIRGVHGEGNSVGKSTISDLIFYSLGGDLTVWKDEAKLCDYTIAEVIINGNQVTLRREIKDKARQPMAIFFGDFEASQISGSDGWQLYPYQRYQDRQSFTQVIFRLLDMPELPAEAESNITVHQLLRLMYVDQITPVDRIFRFEAHDSALRRQAVGDLLCGVFDDRIYPAQLELRSKEREYDVATQQFGTLNRVLARVGEGFNLSVVEDRHRKVKLQISETQAEIEQLQKRRFSTKKPDNEQGIIDTLQNDLIKINNDLTNIRLKTNSLEYSIQDANLLIKEIEHTLVRLKEGEVALSAIGPISFTFCPSCFSELDETEEDKCKLCHKPLDPNASKARTARMRNELSIQLRESRLLQENRKNELISLRSRLNQLEAIRDSIADEFVNLSRNYVTEADTKIDQLNTKIGYLQRELIDIAREYDFAKQLAELSEHRSDLNTRITTLKESIASWKVHRDRQQASAYHLISKNTAKILSQDLLTEKEFTLDSTVYFDFSEDRISVNGKTGFSASSLTVLRNAFHLALHLASCQDKTFRYPRFTLMDNIEDKGMTEARSQNFQRLLVKMCSELSVEHQIIFTTSMIDPSLDNDQFTVGDKYDFNNKSLKIR